MITRNRDVITVDCNCYYFNVTITVSFDLNVEISSRFHTVTAESIHAWRLKGKDTAIESFIYSFAPGRSFTYKTFRVERSDWFRTINIASSSHFLKCLWTKRKTITVRFSSHSYHPKSVLFFLKYCKHTSKVVPESLQMPKVGYSD